MAAKLLEFSVALARDDEDKLVQLVPDLGRSLEEIGQLRRAEEVFGEVAEKSPVARFEVASLRDYTRATAESFQELEAAAKASRRKLKPAERARAAILAAEVSWTKGEYSKMDPLLTEARGAADRLEDSEKELVLDLIGGWEARAILLGPRKPAAGMTRCDAIARATRSSLLQAVALAVKAGLGAMRGKFEEARLDYQESWRIGEAFRLDSWLAALPLYSGPVELLDGNPAHAEDQLRRGYDALEGMGDRSRQATMAAFLAHALYEQGKNDDAKKFALKSKELGAEADTFTEVMWRGALAKALARVGDCTFGLDLAEQAVGLAPSETNAPSLRGDALLDHAEVLRLCDPSNAREKANEAHDVYKVKGNVAAMRRAKALIARLPK